MTHNCDYYNIKLKKEDFNSINIFNHDDIEKFIKKILNKYLKKYNIYGLVIFNIYKDNKYGMIIDIENRKYSFLENNIEIKITFHLNNFFLYKLNYFDLFENITIKNQNIYYYNDNYYLELNKWISNKNYLHLLEISEIIYKNVDEIINKGIKVTNYKKGVI